MFENILFQQQACAELRKEILNGTLPPSILLYGSALTGKTTLALELARVLTCQNSSERGRWTCACWSCQQQRELNQKQVLVLGSSDFGNEIKISRRYFERAWENQLPAKSLRILLLVWLRSLNKVLKRYDAVLWPEGKSKTDKERKAQKVQEEFLELLGKLRPDEVFGTRAELGEKPDAGPLLQDKKSLNKNMNRSEELAGILIAAIPQGIPIQQIRQLQQWSYQTSETGKVAILENVESMNLAASNAMLKLLEEPPPGCCFILTTRRKQALLPTVLSRLRLVPLNERSADEERKVVQTVFRTDDGSTLKELFLTGEQDFSMIMEECQVFMRCLREKRPFFTLKNTFAKLELDAFLQNLGFLLQKECIEQHSNTDQLLAEHNFFWYQKFLQLGREAMERHRVYHDSALLLLQNLYLELLHEGSYQDEA